VATTRASLPTASPTQEGVTSEDVGHEATSGVTGDAKRLLGGPPRYVAALEFTPPSHEVVEQVVGIWRARAAATAEEVVDAVLAGVLSPETVSRSLAQNTGLEGLQLALTEYAVAAAADGHRHRYQRLLDLKQAKVAVLERAGGAVTVEEVRPLLGDVSRQAVEKRRERGALLAIRIGGEYRYPLCQFADGDVLPGLSNVLRAFTMRNPWTQLSVLVAPQDALDGRSLLDALRAGDVDEAAAVAASFGNTGA